MDELVPKSMWGASIMHVQYYIRVVASPLLTLESQVVRGNLHENEQMQGRAVSLA
jgi:hypothetical protein